MKIATLRLPDRTVAVRQDGDTYTEIADLPDVGALLRLDGWQEVAAAADGERHAVDGADLAPVVPTPGKIVCVGGNYRSHIVEMGSPLPEYPTIFAKYTDALIGATDDIQLPPEDAWIDWEAELAIVIGTPGRRIAPADALDHVAGYSVLNDISMRGYQFRTNQWLQGKSWEKSTPLGPALVTPDEVDPTARIRTVIDGEIVQDSTIGDLLFGPREIIAYLSTLFTLRPGDVIATGTPDGVGFAREPKQFLRPGNLVETSIDGLGALRNRAVAEAR
ncbi:fumarylacetoacetate hydrolase family protein [Georgenia thermotolerans]|uniref:FAA hydrolase family protein n=1 Tax=Georgenia thermotolerans TaxID=527326 RepID=A0A7J5ULL2_9MICO|nr:fumarylacetoacetate hydrolase family protein [Georgenia thermotolerans]KAE8763246.1 FAA hydrolase family protein [Georgenia thermotolerans]